MYIKWPLCFPQAVVDTVEFDRTQGACVPAFSNEHLYHYIDLHEGHEYFGPPPPATRHPPRATHPALGVDGFLLSGRVLPDSLTPPQRDPDAGVGPRQSSQRDHVVHEHHEDAVSSDVKECGL